MAKAPEINRIPPGRVREIVSIARSGEIRVFKKPHGRKVGIYLVGRAAPHKHATVGITYDTEKYSRRTWQKDASVDEKTDLANKRIDAVKKALEAAGFKKGAENIERRLKDFVEKWVPDMRGKTGYVLAEYEGIPVLMPKVAFVVAQKGAEKDKWRKVLEGATRDAVIQQMVEKGMYAELRRVLAPEELRTWLPPEEVAVIMA